MIYLIKNFLLKKELGEIGAERSLEINRAAIWNLPNLAAIPNNPIDFKNDDESVYDDKF